MAISRKIREELKQELQRHCEEVFMDPKKQKEVQEERIKYFKKRGDQQFTKDGRGAEITIDWVLQARAKMSGNSVNGPESRRCKRKDQTLASRKIYIITRCFPGTLVRWKHQVHGRSCRALALTSKCCASCIVLRLEKEKEPESWK